MSNARRDTHCPVCGKNGPVERQDETVRYCVACRFQWSTEESEALLIGRTAAFRARKQMEGL